MAEVAEACRHGHQVLEGTTPGRQQRFHLVERQGLPVAGARERPPEEVGEVHREPNLRPACVSGKPDAGQAAVARPRAHARRAMMSSARVRDRGFVAASSWRISAVSRSPPAANARYIAPTTAVSISEPE